MRQTAENQRKTVPGGGLFSQPVGKEGKFSLFCAKFVAMCLNEPFIVIQDRFPQVQPVCMEPVKVNIFISHAPADKPVADKLLEWLYPMRDEVNVWHYDPPRAPEQLPLSWQILLPWYRPVDPRVLYGETLKKRRSKAHIYLFLTSYKSLNNKQVDEDISLAVSRRIDSEWDDLAPLILPVLVSPSRWKEESRLAQFTPLAGGIPLSKFPRSEDGFLLLAEQLAKMVKVIQVRLNEARYYHYHPEMKPRALQSTQSGSLPYLGEQPDQFKFEPPAPFRPPDWMGWSLIALILTVSVGSFRKVHPAVSSLHLKARPAKEYEIEYPREVKMRALPDTMTLVLPPVE